MEGAASIPPGRNSVHPYTLFCCPFYKAFRPALVRSFKYGIDHQLFTGLLCLDGKSC
jgi:hypothetical protein